MWTGRNPGSGLSFTHTVRHLIISLGYPFPYSDSRNLWSLFEPHATFSLPFSHGTPEIAFSIASLRALSSLAIKPKHTSRSIQGIPYSFPRQASPGGMQHFAYLLLPDDLAAQHLGTQTHWDNGLYLHVLAQQGSNCRHTEFIGCSRCQLYLGQAELSWGPTPPSMSPFPFPGPNSFKEANTCGSSHAMDFKDYSNSPSSSPLSAACGSSAFDPLGCPWEPQIYSTAPQLLQPATGVA